MDHGERAREASIWRALSDPTRRGILDLLRRGPATTGRISAEFAISRVAVMRHLSVLFEAGLVVNRKRGRERWHYLNAVPLRRVYRRWVGLAESGWAEGLLRLESLSEAASMAEALLALDIVQEISLAAPRTKVFEAITEHVDSWWGHPYANERATGLTLEARLGGGFVETWAEGGGRLLAVVTALDPDRHLELTGPFHLGVAFGVAQFDLEERSKGKETLLRFSHRAFGDIGPSTAEQYQLGWGDLLAKRLKAFVDKGTRAGIGVEE